MDDPIRILLVDDQRLMRDGLRTLLELESDLQVVGEAANGAEAVARYRAEKPDVVLMDVQMPGMGGVEATRQLVSEWPRARVIIVTTFDNDEYIFDGLRAGARGYLLKDVSGKELAEAVRTVAAGGALIGPSVTRKVLAEFSRIAPPARSTDSAFAESLSQRELEILSLMARGMTNREIALQISLAPGTVKNYVTSILGKTGARDRTQAALWAKERGLL